MGKFRKAMDDQAHIRISWRKLVCVVSVLLLMGIQVSTSYCAAEVFSGHSSTAGTRCSGMPMSASATSECTESRAYCCQLTRDTPVTFRQSTDTTKAAFLFVSLRTGLSGAVATRTTTPRPVDSSPPRNVQSLFCTLLL